MVLVMLGAFLLSGAALTRFYVAERVLGARPDVYAVVETEARGATYFDPGTATVRTGTLRGTTTLRGDVGASGPRRVVWDAFTEVAAADGSLVSYRQERAAFDRRSGVALGCCGESAEGRPATHSGLVFRWPYGTAPRDTSLWDVTTRRAHPARFAGAEVVEGLVVYRFVSEVPPTAISSRGLPPRLLGVAPRAAGRADVPVTLWAAATRTYWVEPVTGTPVRAEERVRQAYRTADGRERLTVLDGTLAYTAAQVAVSTAEARAELGRVRVLTGTVPTAGVVGGGVALAAGAVLASLTRGGRAKAGAAPESRMAAASGST
ncbi:DUF3068 domain-containing protein [Sphaerisporangium rubeum]